MEFILNGCLWLTGKLTGASRDGPGMPGWRSRAEARAALAVVLFGCVIVGTPVLIVLWGYATGRLPAASPYVD